MPTRPYMTERIIEESVRLFVQKGFKGTTIKDITGSVNLTRGAMYWHFKSKDDLLKTIIKYYEKAYMDGLIKSVKSVDGDFLTRFRQYHKYSTEFARQQQTSQCRKRCGSGTWLPFYTRGKEVMR